MTETPASDRFSWKRTVEFGRLYTPGLIKALTFYAIAYPVLFTAGAILPEHWRLLFIQLTSIISLLFPMLFALRDQTIMRLAPASAKEKTAFYIGSIIVVCNVLLSIYSILLMLFFSTLVPERNILTIAGHTPMEYWHMLGTANILYIMIWGGIWGLFIQCVILDSILRAQKISYIKPVLWGLLAYVFMTVMTMIAGFAYGIYLGATSTDPGTVNEFASGFAAGYAEGLSGRNSEVFIARTIINQLHFLFIMMGVFGLCALPFVIRRIYKSQK